MKKITLISLSALFAASLSLSAQAADNPFGMADLDKSSLIAMSSTPDGKCGGGKCGDSKDKKEGKCGDGKDKKEGKCGDGKDKKDAKCGGN